MTIAEKLEGRMQSYGYSRFDNITCAKIAAQQVLAEAPGLLLDNLIPAGKGEYVFLYRYIANSLLTKRL